MLKLFAFAGVALLLSVVLCGTQSTDAAPLLFYRQGLVQKDHIPVYVQYNDAPVEMNYEKLEKALMEKRQQSAEHPANEVEEVPLEELSRPVRAASDSDSNSDEVGAPAAKGADQHASSSSEETIALVAENV